MRANKISKITSDFKMDAISIGNDMISSAIWCQEARVNFSMTTKLHKPVERVQFVVFAKISAYLLDENT